MKDEPPCFVDQIHRHKTKTKQLSLGSMKDEMKPPCFGNQIHRHKIETKQLRLDSKKDMKVEIIATCSGVYLDTNTQ